MGIVSVSERGGEGILVERTAGQKSRIQLTQEHEGQAHIQDRSIGASEAKTRARP